MVPNATILGMKRSRESTINWQWGRPDCASVAHQGTGGSLHPMVPVAEVLVAKSKAVVFQVGKDAARLEVDSWLVAATAQARQDGYII